MSFASHWKDEGWVGRGHAGEERVFLGARIQGHMLSQKGMVSFSEIKNKNH